MIGRGLLARCFLPLAPAFSHPGYPKRLDAPASPVRPNNSFKPKTNRYAIFFGVIQALGRMNQNLARLISDYQAKVRAAVQLM